MRPLTPLSFVLMLAGLFFLPPAPALQAAGNLTQNSSRECAICHFRWIEHFIEGHGTALAEYEKEDVAGHEMICFSCHDGSTDDSRRKVWILDRHKTDILPSDKVVIPKLFPLSQDGKIVCATCHSAHSVPTDTSIERTIFLRISNKDSIMCEMCHADQAVKDRNHPTHSGKRPIPQELYAVGAVPSATDTNFVICESCHTAHGSVERNLLFEVKKQSTLCTLCHPGEYDAPNAPLDKQVNHPLLVEFKQNPNVGGVKIQLGPQNSLECLSCHKVHQYEKGNKALVKNKEALCQLCHADKADRSSIADWQKANHPLYVKYKLDPASQVKLDGGPDNTVYCFTCHKVHQHAPGTKALAGQRDPLCATCHKAQYLVDNTDHDLSITAKDEINVLKQPIKEAGVCSACHIPHKATGPYLWARKVKDPASLSSPSKLCLTCHNDKGTAAKKIVGRFTHPVDVAMKADQLKDPKTLPLYTKTDGTAVMECHTCHDPHRWDAASGRKGTGINDEGTPLTSFLRKRSGSDSALCASCHMEQYYVEGTDHDLTVTAPKESNISKQTAGQAGVCSPCHVPHQASGPYLWARKFDKKPTSPSSLCLDCHAKKKPAEKKMVGQNTHPVNVKIEDPVNLTLPLRKLSDGTSVMECHTCHDPHKWNSRLNQKGKKENVEGSADNSFLRSANLEQPTLCAKCHLRKSFVAGTDHDLRVVAPTSLNTSGKMAREESVCTPCHAVHNAPQKTLLWNYPLADTGQDFIEKACNGCHAKNRAGKDKVLDSGIHPRQFYFGYHKSYRNILLSIGPTPDPIPLYTLEGGKSASGEITCSTCHDPHIWYASEEAAGPGKNTEGIIVNSFLRKGARNELCYACHGIKTLLLYRFYHNANEKKSILGISMPSADEIEKSNSRQPAGEYNENDGVK